MKNSFLKFMLCFILFIYCSTSVIPIIFCKDKSQISVSRDEILNTKNPEFLDTVSILETTGNIQDSFRIFDSSSGKITTIKYKDFLIGSLAYEMTPDVPTEALKAQTVAAFSYYSYISSQRQNEDYDIIWSSNNNFTYITNEQLKEMWDDNYQTNYNILENVVNSVLGERIIYDNATACSSFFVSSNGQTQNATDIWGEDFPYLINVASPYDSLSSGYESKFYFEPEFIQKTLENTWPDAKMDFSLDYEDWFSQINYTIGAAVSYLNVCGYSVTGNELRIALSLASPTFSVSFVDDKFEFRCKGRGDGVGLSQTGACYMASQGASYREILLWYFPGTTIG